MAISESQRAAYLQLLRDFLDGTVPENVVSAQHQRGVRPEGNVRADQFTPFGEHNSEAKYYRAYSYDGEEALIFVSHHVENPPKIPRIVRGPVNSAG